VCGEIFVLSALLYRAEAASDYFAAGCDNHKGVRVNPPNFLLKPNPYISPDFPA